MDNAIKRFWEHEFGNREEGHDFAGWNVRKGAYGQKGSKFAWNIDHILPKSMGGTDDINNLQITHMETNSERGNRMTFWLEDVPERNGVPVAISYQVKRVSRLNDDDEVADYCNHYEGKKYCVVIQNVVEVDEEE
ncbi:MAG: HNH endonuclease [Treponematales bacterium]